VAKSNQVPPASQPTTQPKLVLPFGRGSRGKTFWVRWAVERAQSQGRDVVVADLDRTNPALAVFFDGVVAPPSADDRDVRETLAAFVEKQIEQRFTAVVDLGGGDQILKRVAAEFKLVQFLAKHDITPVAVHLIGADAADLSYLQEVEREGLFAPAATILVLNESLAPPHRTPAAAFESTVRHHAILTQTIERGARLVRMPRLEPAGEIDSGRLSFAAAEEGRARDGQLALGVWKRQLVAIWRREMETAFASVAEWLP
jgi:hypothetical protein